MSALTLHEPEVTTGLLEADHDAGPEAVVLPLRLAAPYVTVRVGTAEAFAGEIELEVLAGRWVVRRHARGVLPRDIVLKVLVQFARRDETFGKLTGRDGRTYFWHVLNPLAGDLSDELEDDDM
jgi:hypothetical protein